MTGRLAVVLLSALPGVAGQPAPLVGALPARMPPPVRLVWIPAVGGPSIACAASGARWRCDAAGSPDGLVVGQWDDRVGVQPVRWGASGPWQVRRWGSVVRVAAGLVSEPDLRALRAMPERPERSAARPRTLRLGRISQPDVDVLRLSDTAFWVAGDAIDEDAFLTIDGPAIATLRLPLAQIAAAPVDAGIEVVAAAPATLSGRVQASGGEDVEGVAVELYEPLHEPPRDTAEPSRDAAEPPAGNIFVGSATTGPGGLFAFDRVGHGPFTLYASHARLGRATAIVRSVADPVVVRLTPPSRVTGRILRRHLPVPGASVRFVPDRSALADSTDPYELIADEQLAGADGRFTILLPPKRAGTLAIRSGADAMARIRLPDAGGGDLMLGDIELPDPVLVTVRLLDPAPCTLSAAGPLGALGLSIVDATPAQGFYLFAFPEAGEWVLDAKCGQHSVRLVPQTIAVAASGVGSAPPLVDIRIAR